jgi:ribosomal protein S18 acetylase RimI-like enzyme
MEHPLDNPAWNALISGNEHLSFGNGPIRYFGVDVSPFAALKENTAENFSLLYELRPHTSPVLFVSTAEIEIPAPWKVVRVIKGRQMVYDGLDVKEDDLSLELVPLTDEHVPQMLALTKLANPGPFESRTIAFGHYYGIFDEDKLVAMAGQRLHAFNYAEISAVCTHPDYLGKGYAGKLLLHQVNRIKAASCIPFLHVRDDNERAIKVYERVGFFTRTNVYFNLLVKG